MTESIIWLIISLALDPEELEEIISEDEIPAKAPKPVDVDATIEDTRMEDENDDEGEEEDEDDGECGLSVPF